MKNIVHLFLCLTGLLLAAGSAHSVAVEPDVEIGDTIPAVVAKIGKPEGQFQQGSILTFYYSRGMVDFTDGRVVQSSLVSSEEALRIRQERERLAADQRRRAEAEQNRLTQVGATELKKKLDDKVFTALPAAERLAAWQDFNRRYPYTDVASYLTSAQNEVDQFQQKQKAQEEIPPIKKRLAEIQSRFGQLDKDYAASLANWKRNEITAERARLTAEQTQLESRLQILVPPPNP